MNEEEKTLKYLSAMRIIDFNKLGFVYGKETIDEVLNLIQKQQKEIKLLKDQQQYAIDEYGNTIKEKQTELEKKDKVIDELASRVYLNKQEMEEMEKYIYNNPNHKGFADFVKRYFERKVKNENRNN